MTMRSQNDLLLLNIISFLLIVVIVVFPSNTLRIVLGLPFLLFIPGYMLIVALFPRKDQLDNIERVAMSSLLSIIMVSFSVFALNFTPWGIRLYPVLIVLTAIILFTSLTAWYRRRRIVGSDETAVTINFSLAFWRRKSILDKLLLSILALTVLGTIGILGYAVVEPRTGEKFTEFYILGANGKVEGYPDELVLGEEATVIVGIVNREHERVNYRVEVRINGVKNNEWGPLVLDHDTKREEIIDFQPGIVEDNQKVEFLLYKQGQGESYRSLYLRVNVKRGD
jgi:uncharacterized membrane protein